MVCDPVNEMNDQFRFVLKREIKTPPIVRETEACYFIHSGLLLLLFVFLVKYRIFPTAEIKLCRWDIIGRSLIHYIQ